jgi:hypothetical protein
MNGVILGNGGAAFDPAVMNGVGIGGAHTENLARDFRN